MNHLPENEWLHLATTLGKSGHNEEEITLQLKQKGAPETVLKDIIAKLKSLRLARRRQVGFTCCTIGVVLLVVGCMITIFLYNTGYDIKFALYGLTIVGLGFTFKGLVDIIGW
jgi:hypothetical protein